MRHMLTISLVLAFCISLTASFAPAADQPKIKALLITGDDVKAHPWKEICEGTKGALAESGRFDVTVAEDWSPLEDKDALAKYDVIVWTRFNAKKLPISEAAQGNLLSFVKGGKGFVVTHLASASFPKWDEWSTLCGRHWIMGKSGHGPRSVFETKIVDKDHPITKGLSAFKQDDELYAKLVGDTEIHVLVTADSAWSKKTEPLAFILEYGKGKVFHSAFGHDGKALATPEVRKLLARGAEWAATGKVTVE